MINLVQNDTKPTLEFTCTQYLDCETPDGQVDISGCTVRFSFKKAFASTAKFKRVCDITDSVNGVCQFSWETGDLDEAGDFEGELEITFTDSKIQTSDKIYFHVREEIA